MKKHLIKITKSATNYLLARYKHKKQSANNNSLEHCLGIAHHMLKKSKYCFFVTQGQNGWCSARLVEPIIENLDKDNFVVWVGTRKDLRKTNEVWSNSKVTLAFENTRENANLVIYGNAFVETDPKIKHHYWKNTMRLFFPSGPKSNEYVAIRVEPIRLEIMNFSKNITPEPFGLKPVVLLNHQDNWQLG